MRQLRRYLQKHLQRQVRIGLPTGIGHLLDEYRTPAHAATVGLLIYGVKYARTSQETEPTFFQEVVSALGEMVNRVLSRSEKKH